MRKVFVLSLALFFLAAQPALSIDFQHELLKLIPEGARLNGKLGVVVTSLENDEKVFAFNSEKLFIPASNIKIITAAAALSILKPNYRFKTEFYSGGEVSEGGVLHGGLYVKGYGDPSLTAEHLQQIAHEFKRRGIRKIKDGITVDDSYFGGAEYGKGWKEEWKGEWYSPPLSALSLNYNTFKIKAYSSKIGKPPIVSLEPAGTNVNVINKAVTTKKGGKLHARWLEGGKTIALQGAISHRYPSYEIELTTWNPSLYTGSVFKKALEEIGIQIEGFVRIGIVPSWAELFHAHLSEPLDWIVAEYNKNSVNIIGESVFKTLGAEVKGAPGTWEKGSQVVSDFLRQAGIREPFNIVDGSGLSPQNRVSPQTLAQVLKYAYGNRLISSKFMSSLPIAGVDGTLKKRFKHSEIQGRVFAKTGHLKNVSALSGYIYTKTGDMLAFSILANGLGWGVVSEFQNDLLTVLLECCEDGKPY